MSVEKSNQSTSAGLVQVIKIKTLLDIKRLSL